MNEPPIVSIHLSYKCQIYCKAFLDLIIGSFAPLFDFIADKFAFNRRYLVHFNASLILILRALGLK